jgi:hypothetical protein
MTREELWELHKMGMDALHQEALVDDLKIQAAQELGAMEDHLGRAQNLIWQAEQMGAVVPDELCKFSRLIDNDDFNAWVDWLEPYEE